MSLGILVKIILAIFAAAAISNLPFIGLLTNVINTLVGNSGVATIIVATVYFIAGWFVVGAAGRFIKFAFGGGIGRYSTTKIYRHFQYVTFTISMSLIIATTIALLITVSPARVYSADYFEKVESLTARRLQFFRDQITSNESRMVLLQMRADRLIPSPCTTNACLDVQEDKNRAQDELEKLRSQNMRYEHYLIQPDFTRSEILRDSDENFSTSLQALIEKYWKIILLSSLVFWLFIQVTAKQKITAVATRILEFFDQSRMGRGGAARFATMFEEWRNIHAQGKLFIGRSTYNPWDYLGLGGDAHMLTVAGSRGGKGSSVIIPNLLEWTGSVVVIDPKGTNAHVTAEARRKMGHDVHIIDPFNIVTEDSARFDPLADLDAENRLLPEWLGSITNALVHIKTDAKDPHWDEKAKTVIGGMIAHMLSEGNEKNGFQTYESSSIYCPKIRTNYGLIWQPMVARQASPAALQKPL